MYGKFTISLYFCIAVASAASIGNEELVSFIKLFLEFEIINRFMFHRKGKRDN